MKATIITAAILVLVNAAAVAAICVGFSAHTEAEIANPSPQTGEASYKDF